MFNTNCLLAKRKQNICKILLIVKKVTISLLKHVTGIMKFPHFLRCSNFPVLAIIYNAYRLQYIQAVSQHNLQVKLSTCHVMQSDFLYHHDTWLHHLPTETYQLQRYLTWWWQSEGKGPEEFLTSTMKMEAICSLNQEDHNLHSQFRCSWVLCSRCWMRLCIGMQLCLYICME